MTRKSEVLGIAAGTLFLLLEWAGIVVRKKVSQKPDQTFQADFKKLVFKSIAWKLIKRALDFTQN